MLSSTYGFLRKINYSIFKKVIFEKGVKIDRKSEFKGYNKIYRKAELVNCHIGIGTYVGYSSKLINCSIGRFSSIGPEVRTVVGSHPSKIYASTHPAFYSMRKQAGFTFADKQYFSEYKVFDSENSLGINIGNDVWVGQGAMILEGVTIGDGAIVAAGCVVHKNIEPYAIYAGCPQSLLKFRFEKDEIDFLIKLQWWNMDFNFLKTNFTLFHNIKDLMKFFPSLLSKNL